MVTLVEAQMSERASKREALAAERRAALEQRQHDALIMLRNIPFVKCVITSAQSVLEGKGAGTRHTVYQIELSVPKDQFKASSHSVLHRYSRFVTLHEALTKEWGKRVELPALPPKQYTLGALSAAQTADRQRKLELYLTQLVTILNWAVEPNVRAFFEADRWVKERKTKPSSAASSPEK